jgi:photosystem II stability/assembly factor-like uncharacterized protein
VGATVRFQAVSVVNDDVVWVSGLEGTYARTTDGGASWTTGVVPEGESLQFRDVQAVDGETAYLLSSGQGEQSRVYKTHDGGASWELQLVNEDPEGFFDCFDFWDADRGLLYGDSVAGRLVVLGTSDGANWSAVPEEGLPPAREGEGGFAASGTCVATLGDEMGFIGIGTGAGAARVLRTRDGAKSFEAFETPIASSTLTSGVTSLAFWDDDHGAAVGGDVAALDEAQSGVIATTEDGGRRWRLATPPPFAGAVYGVAYVPGTTPPPLVVVGPKGAALTRDLGETWVSLSSESFWSVGFAPSGLGFAVGPEGRVSRIEIPR